MEVKRLMRVLTTPNLITAIRLALVPVTAYFLAIADYAIALPCFLAAAVSDLADGYIARRFGLASRLGALLDPVADKLTMLVAAVMLTLLSQIPLWLGIAIVARDAVIVAGAAAWRFSIGRLDIAPTRLSKINTVIEFAALLCAMAVGAEWLEGGRWLAALFVLTLASIVASGLQYVLLWGRKAWLARAAQ